MTVDSLSILRLENILKISRIFNVIYTNLLSRARNVYTRLFSDASEKFKSCLLRQHLIFYIFVAGTRYWCQHLEFKASTSKFNFT